MSEEENSMNELPGSAARPVFKRVLIKLSGEAFMDSSVGYGIDTDVVSSIAERLSEVQGMGVQLALVVGGGNIFRGDAASAKGMDLSLIHISEPTRLGMISYA